jgi:hypothetical protein
MTVRASSSSFMHLCCEMWRRIGIPVDLGPPVGSFLDLKFRRSGLDIHFPARIELRHLNVWLANARAREHLEATEASAEAYLASYRRMVERSRWSRLGRLLGIGPTARRPWR